MIASAMSSRSRQVNADTFLGHYFQRIDPVVADSFMPVQRQAIVHMFSTRSSEGLPINFRKSIGCGRPFCRHDGAPSSSILATHQDRCVPRRSKCAFTARKAHGAGFLIAKSARSRANRYLPCQFRTGFASGLPSRYGRQHPKGPYGEYRMERDSS
jgi:hypothetical protein